MTMSGTVRALQRKRALEVTGALILAVSVAACSLFAGFPTPKDTALDGAPSLRQLSACESLFGKAPDVATALKMPKSADFTWSLGITAEPSAPLSCAASNRAAALTVVLFVNRGERKCSPVRRCGEASDGIWAEAGLIQPMGSKLSFPSEATQ